MLKRLTEDRPDLEGVRVVYADLDGTLLGPGGSLFAVGERRSDRAARAVATLHGAGIELVLVSGRTRDGMREPARVLGASAFVAELGALTVEMAEPDEVIRSYGAYPGHGSPFGAMVRQGAGAFLLERYPGRLEPHAPRAAHRREATMLFRGLVDVDEVSEGLRAAGYAWLALHDNGIIRPSPTLDLEQVRAYHLAPVGVSKGAGVRAHLERRGLSPRDAIAIGDSPSDLAIAPEVRAMFVVANGVAAVGDARGETLYATAGATGDGFAEVVGLLVPPTAASPVPGG